ncbi:hypothetical protein Dtox_3419 [Desulfofarcimen acetoxidans DSM 771]|uniref:Uncharacterized protein n=2 Tax=Desulfofarcimen acetoxidans TaxID=58138 RepID=C8W6N4_DESAS|nr:hypothetical protein Dtox_3419 [Desulfofarcimen acetoxidans DSM 771]
MKIKLKYLAAVGTIVLMVPLLHLPYTKDAAPSPENRPVCDLNRGSGDVALPPSQQHSTGHTAPEMPPQNTSVIENSVTVTEPEPQLTKTPEKKESVPASTPSTKPTAPPSPAPVRAAEPQMGDTRVVDGQKHVYFLGFGWIEDSSEPNHGEYAADMYENSNKIGVIDGGTAVGGDGDINKIWHHGRISRE